MHRDNPSRRCLLLSVLPAVLLLAALPARGQEPADSCLRRTVFASVVDRDGYPIAGLSAEDFQGRFLGTPVRILSAKSDTLPKKMVILLDASGSMRGKDSAHSKWKMATVVAAHVTKTFAPKAPVALLLFNDKAYVVEFSEGQEEILKYLRALKPKEVIEKQVYGSTALHSAVLGAMKLLGKPEPGDVIFAITDGFDNISDASASQVEAVLVKSGVRLFVALLPDVEMRPRRLPGRPFGSPRLFSDIAIDSGGSFAEVPSPKKPRTSAFQLDDKTGQMLEERLQGLYTALTGAYRIELELGKRVELPWELELKLAPKEGLNPKDLRLNYPRKLLPCAAGATK